MRVLSWYGFIGNTFTHNMPGYGRDADYDVKQAASRGMAAAVMPGGAQALPPLPEPTDPQDRREVFNARWYRDAFSGKIKNLSMRTRDVSADAAAQGLEKEAGIRGFVETLALQGVATHHQKTLLIDYEHDDGAHAVGYVMGLNSVTDYWDTKSHLFHDPRRGQSWEGANDVQPGLKPYQDYACRIRGEALVAVNRNFTAAWNRAKGSGEKLARGHDLNHPPAGLARHVNRCQRAQIVRTQPEEGEKSIQRLYRQATSFARQYLYVENQYFQDTQWAQQLRQARQGFVKGWKEAGQSLEDLPNLHVMAVIPTPEKALMVPRTYDTVRALDQASSMPNQDKQIQDELDAHAKWEREAAALRAQGKVLSPYAYPGPMSELAKSAKEAGERDKLSQELAGMGMRTLAGSLWTFDHQWASRQRKELEHARQWEGMPSQTQRHKVLMDRISKDRYREIYIHSKLMLIDDAFFTLGSANLNQRSMATDSEINIGSDDKPECERLRREVWEMLTGDAPDCNPATLTPKLMALAFTKWQKLMSDNAKGKAKGEAPTGFLFPFRDERTSRIRAG